MSDTRISTKPFVFTAATGFQVVPTTTVFLTSGTSWDATTAGFNSANNTIECIGAGGSGGDGSGGGTIPGAGGGGGGYAKSTNVTLTGLVTCQIGSGTSGTASLKKTWISNTGVEPTTTAQGVLANGGALGILDARGLGGSTTGALGNVITYAGGNGGVALGTITPCGSGGGGAAGPFGVGGNGGATTAAGADGGSGGGGNGGGGNGVDQTGGLNGTAGGIAQDGTPGGIGGIGLGGGNGSHGSGGGGGINGRAGGLGGNGVEWDATHGSGGGAGGSGLSGRAGGLYGGGGGGSDEVNPGGAGANGIIKITWVTA